MTTDTNTTAAPSTSYPRTISHPAEMAEKMMLAKMDSDAISVGIGVLLRLFFCNYRKTMKTNTEKQWFMWTENKLSLYDRIKVLLGWKIYTRFDSPNGNCSAACGITHQVTRAKYDDVHWRNVKEHAPSPAGAHSETGVEVQTTPDSDDKAAGGGCCVSSCSVSSSSGGFSNGRQTMIRPGKPEKWTRPYVAKAGQAVRIDGAWVVLVRDTDILSMREMEYDQNNDLRRSESPLE